MNDLSHNISSSSASPAHFWMAADDWLDRKPQNIILEEQIWNDPKLITGLLANYYDRLPAHTSLTTGWDEFAAYDEAMWSNNDDGRNNIISYPFDRWRLWDYRPDPGH